MSTHNRVLVVDDDQAVRQLMAAILGQAGYETRDACDAYEALRVAEAESFDLLLTDLDMPGLTGLDLIRSLEQQGKVVPTLVVSGCLGTISRSVAGVQGPVWWLCKPFTPDQLVSNVHAMLEKYGHALPVG